MEKNSLEQNIFRFIPFCKKRNLRLSVVIKMSENNRFQAFGNFETIGSKFRYGISKKVATVRNHLRKGSKKLSSKKISVWFPKRMFSLFYFATLLARTKFPSVAEPFPATAGVTI